MGTHLREPGVSPRLVESFSIFGNRTRGLPQPCVTQILKDIESGVAFIIIDTERRSPLAGNNFERLKGAKKREETPTLFIGTVQNTPKNVEPSL